MYFLHCILDILTLLLPGVNFINILRAHFSYESASRSFSLVTFWLHNLLSKGYLQKSCAKNVDEIDYRCQCHQHFTLTFFIQKCFGQLFSSYILALVKGFWQKSTYKKHAHKMLMILTTEINVHVNTFKTHHIAENVRRKRMWQLDCKYVIEITFLKRK